MDERLGIEAARLAVKLSIKQRVGMEMSLQSFHVQYFYPDKDFSYTWKEHGGLSGHVVAEKRESFRRDRVYKDVGLLLRQNPEFNIERYCDLVEIFNSIINGYPFQRDPVDISYNMVSGLSFLLLLWQSLSLRLRKICAFPC